jgi:spore coat polysaccharide biosynthesis predicted glycosyltransferase SpsG
MSRVAARVQCVFRVAAGPRIGFGHLLRARSLARAMGQQPVVSVRGGAAARAAARTLGCRLLDKSAEALGRADVLVVDDPSARHGASWIRSAQLAGIPSVAVHDAGIGVRRADLVIDGSIAAHPGRRDTRALSGPSFCILDPAVLHVRRRPRGDRRRRRPVVLVSLGGGDQVRQHAARVVSEIARRCPEVSIRVATGMSDAPLPALPGGRWIVRRNGLGCALHGADVAVVAGGVTLYEACAIGTPAVATAVVPAQRVAIDAFVRAGAALDGGCIGTMPDVAARRIAAAVASLVGATAARKRLVFNGRRLVDGQGALRAARQIRQLRILDRRKVRHA